MGFMKKRKDSKGKVTDKSKEDVNPKTEASLDGKEVEVDIGNQSDKVAVVSFEENVVAESSSKKSQKFPKKKLGGFGKKAEKQPREKKDRSKIVKQPKQKKSIKNGESKAKEKKVREKKLFQRHTKKETTGEKVSGFTKAKKSEKKKFRLYSPKQILKKFNERSREKLEKSEFKRVEKVSFLHQIQFKLYSLIVIPILFLIILGVVSYQKASTGIRQSYVESASSAVELTTSYYDFVFDTLKSNYNEVLTESKLRTYVNGGYAKMETTDGLSYYNEKYKTFNYDVTDNKFLRDVYVVTDNDKSIATTNATVKDLYSQLLSTEQGAMAAENNNAYFYFGTMPKVDEALKADPEKYAIRILHKIPKGEGFLILDLDREEMEKLLAQLEIGEGSIVSFITQDGTEIYDGKLESTEGEMYFYGQDYYKEFMADSEKTTAQKFVTYKGKSYMLLMAKVGDTNAAICGLIPESTINEQASEIRNVTLVLVIVSIMLSLVLGMVIAQGMSNTISSILRQIKKVSQGDLTVQIRVRRKDEFAVLATGISDMIAHTKHLIQKVEGVSTELTGISQEVIRSSESFLASSKGIESSVGEIEIGTNDQAQHSVECLNEMDNLSNRIQVVHQNAQKISEIAGDTDSSIQTGMGTMKILNEKSHSTAEITNVVIDSIQQLEKQTKSIGQIVSAINDISSETNLLSLNASIEAARAGEAGRGFSVVASEIRKLADQSMESANQIQKIIEQIVLTTKNAVQIAQQADTIVQEQQTAVDDTTDAFKDMEKQVALLMKELEDILAGVKEMDKTRSITLDAIRGISAVSEETAASATNVTDVVGKQLEEVEDLSQNSERLSASAEELEQAIGQFTIR